MAAVKMLSIITFRPVTEGGDRLLLIKDIRTLLGCGLKDGKDLIESGRYECAPDVALSLAGILRKYTKDVQILGSPREHAVNRLGIACKAVENKVVIRVANFLADILEKVA